MPFSTAADIGNWFLSELFPAQDQPTDAGCKVAGSTEGRLRKGKPVKAWCPASAALGLTSSSTGMPEIRGRNSGGAQGQNRTADTMIFSHVLYQLSYLGARRLYRLARRGRFIGGRPTPVQLTGPLSRPRVAGRSQSARGLQRIAASTQSALL